MTKNNFFLLVLLSCCTVLKGCAQSKNLLNAKLQLLQNSPEYKFPFDSTGFSKIKNAQFLSENDDTDVFDINSDNVHLVDFNNDGKKDIIYHEVRRHQATVLLVNKGNDFVEIWNGPGALVNVKQGKETTIYVRANSIGCFSYTMLFELTFKNDNSFTQSTIGHHSDTQVKKLNKTLVRQKLSGTLRTQPKIDDQEKKDPCTGDIMKGNQIRNLDNEEVTILKEKDSWLLVLYKNKETSLVSWIKK